MYFYSTNEEQLKNMNKIAFLCKKKAKNTGKTFFAFFIFFGFQIILQENIAFIILKYEKYMSQLLSRGHEDIYLPVSYTLLPF